MRLPRRLAVSITVVTALSVLTLPGTAFASGGRQSAATSASGGAAVNPQGTVIREVASVGSSYDAKTKQLTLTPQPAKIVTMNKSGQVLSTTFTKPARPFTLQGRAASPPKANSPASASPKAASNTPIASACSNLADTSAPVLYWSMSYKQAASLFS